MIMGGKKAVTEAVQPEHLYAISRMVTRASAWKLALDQIAKLVRAIFIFDNLAVYLVDSNGRGLDVMYAKAVGRGRREEADVAWGELLANKVSESRQTELEIPEEASDTDRLKRPFMLGIPMLANYRYLGAIIFIRFGGPEFSTDNIKLAEYIANQMALLVERQNLEQEYSHLEAQHKQSKLQEDFISTITHELRSPLGFIKGYTTTLMRSDTNWDQDTQQEFLEIIDQETDHLQELIENLLDSARLQSGQLDMTFQPVRLDALMNDVIMRAQLHHPSLRINLQVSKNVPPIEGNPNRLSQVFENLLSNAVKYAGGSDVMIKIAEEDSRVHIYVQDRGPGVSEEYLPFIFDRFYRNPESKSSARGSGLGLYICKQIIDAHNGEITATSRLGTGTSFHIVLPCSKK
jgi:signal transduction histidine kinase